MVQTFGLNSDNDIYIGPDGNLVVLTGLEAIAGACQTISRTALGEMVLSTTQGIPYFEAIWIGTPKFKIWESYLINAIQNVDGVQEVSNLTFKAQSGILTYTATIKTTLGTTQING